MIFNNYNNMDDVTERLRMTQEMADALESEEATKMAADEAQSAKATRRIKDLEDATAEKMKAKYFDNYKTQPRGMKGIESIPEMSAREIDLPDLMKREARKSAVLGKLKGVGKGISKVAGPLAGLGLGMALEQETGPEEGSLSEMIENPDLPEESRASAHFQLRDESEADEVDYFEELRQRKLERALAAKEKPEPEMPEYPMEFTSGDPRSEEAKAYESKAARVKALREKIRSGQY